MPAAAVADALVLAAWIALVFDNLWQARAERPARATLGGVRQAGWRPPLVMRALLVAALLVSAILLERLSGRLPFRPTWALAGLLLVAGGLALHLRARRALGPLWSGVPEVRSRHALVDRGPYARVRHPIYLAVFLLALGSALVHPSLATGCLAGGLAVGLVLKARLEERMLRASLGGDYERYAARVPAFVPTWSRARR